MTTRLPLNAIQTVSIPVRNGGVARYVEYYGTNVLQFFHMHVQLTALPSVHMKVGTINVAAVNKKLKLDHAVFNHQAASYKTSTEILLLFKAIIDTNLLQKP